MTAPDGFASAAARAVGTELTDQLTRSAHVTTVTSASTAPPAAAASLVSEVGGSGLIVAGISGGETNAQKYADSLQSYAHDGNEVTVRSAGSPWSMRRSPSKRGATCW